MQTDAYKHNQRRGLKFSRGMKRKPTKSEKMLADTLTKNGIAFKQQAFFFTHERLFIPDFRIPCKKYKLIVEVDGKNHAKQKEYDEQRTEWLEQNRNCRILRFTNEQVLEDVEWVIKVIMLHKPKQRIEIDMDKYRTEAAKINSILNVAEILDDGYVRELSWVQ
jgi:very-short-patch-repair endonuclease